MKKAIVCIVAIATLVLATACGNKQKTRDEQVMEFTSELTSQDTTTMLNLCDQAMEQLKNKRIDDVLANLYEYTDSTKEVKPLSKATAAQYRRMFKMFPVLEYHRKYFSFQLEGCNDVKYDVVWATAEAAGTEEPARTAYMFNPVKIDGTWHLCVKTLSDDIDPHIQ